MGELVRNRALPAPGILVAGGGLPRRQITVHLVGGPCDGDYARTLSFARRVWQRVPGGHPDRPYFACYTKNFTVRGEFLWAEDEPIISAVDLAERMAEQKRRTGHVNVMGSYGA